MQTYSITYKGKNYNVPKDKIKPLLKEWTKKVQIQEVKNYDDIDLVVQLQIVQYQIDNKIVAKIPKKTYRTELVVNTKDSEMSLGFEVTPLSLCFIVLLLIVFCIDTKPKEIKEPKLLKLG